MHVFLLGVLSFPTNINNTGS